MISEMVKKSVLVEAIDEKMQGYDLWIVKPGSLTHGDKIYVTGDLNEILNLTSKYRKNGFVVQKYIENTAIIHDRKFDIRQWVVITEVHPLTIYIANECYGRFACAKYDKNDLDILKHLTNKSIADAFMGDEKIEIDDK
eukprot:UN28164